MKKVFKSGNVARQSTGLVKHKRKFGGHQSIENNETSQATRSFTMEQSYFPWHWDIWILCFQKLQYESKKISEGEENWPQKWKIHENNQNLN